MKRLAAIMLALFALSAPALADDDDLPMDGTEQTQVVPHAVVKNQLDPKAADPIDMSQVVITTQTPADDFAAATTPLAVALMLGSVGLVVYTLVSQSKRD